MTEKKIPLTPTSQEEKNIAAATENNKTGRAETAAAVAENAKIVAAQAKTRVVTDPAEASRRGVRVGDTVPVNKLAQWKCHKVVTAGKILAFGASFTDPVTVEDVKGEEHKVDLPPNVFVTGRPSLGDYIVLDEAETVSWKTAKAFERDYARTSDWKKKEGDLKTRVITDQEEARLLGVRVGDTVPERERHPAEANRFGVRAGEVPERDPARQEANRPGVKVGDTAQQEPARHKPFG